MTKKLNYEGFSFSKVSREFGLSYRTIQGLVRNGELKLNDYDKIDVQSYEQFKEEWDKKPDWMKKRV